MDLKVTRNIKLCAFLRMKKIHPIGVDVITRGKAEYKYDLSDEDWMKLKVDFNKSEFIEYANCMDAIKDLAY